MTTISDVRQELTKARYRKGLSQKSLAELAKCSPTTVYSYEAGRSMPRGQTLFRIAQVLDLDADQLMDSLAAEVAS